MVDAAFKSIPPELRETIETIVEDAVDRRLGELLGDPDQGLEFREELVQRLQAQVKRVAGGNQGKSMDDVAKELGIK
jgi:hypothetical protein